MNFSPEDRTPATSSRPPTTGMARQTSGDNRKGRSRSDSSLAFQPFFIGIAGGTASGKTTVCERITQKLAGQRVVLLSLDEFYRDLTPEECASISEVNFDEPSAFDVDTMVACLDNLRRCEAAEVPVYDFVTSSRRKDEVRRVKPADVVIVEGILVLHLPEILSRCNMKVFVDTDDDVRLARRIKRDTVARGRDVEGVINQYTRFVKPSFDKYVLPSKLKADIIVPWRDDNDVAVDLITQHIRSKLSQHDLRRIYGNLHAIPATMQSRGMHSKIRSRTCSRQDFVFYSDRLIRATVEAALGFLPFEDCQVSTPLGEPYAGLSFSRKICGVSIIRSGEAMENALRSCCLGVKIGKILIDRPANGSSEMELIYEKLPHDIATRHVLLMDPILATGGTCAAAIEVLIKHRNVDESKIILITLIAAPDGIHYVCQKYPKVHLITSEIDEGIDGDGNVLPGIGNFGDRYFGTTTIGEEHLTVLSPRATRNTDKSSSTDDAMTESPPR